MIHYNIVLGKLRKYANEINESDLDRAFMYFINDIFCDEEDIDEDDNIVDGSRDKQIDLIQIIKKEEEYAIIRIVQVKKEKGFSSNIAIQLRNGLDWVFRKDETELIGISKNAKFFTKVKEIRDVMSEFGTKNTFIEVYYATLGNIDDIKDEDEINHEIKSIEDIYKGTFSNFKFELLGAREIEKLIDHNSKIKNKINAKIDIIYDVNKPSLIEYNDEKIKSVVCYVKAKQISKLIQDNSEYIFDKNVRRYLDLKGKVNQKIYESSKDEFDSKIFWALNNGITIICDKFTIDKVPNKEKLDLENIQIINGCQTSATLYKAYIDGVLNENTVLMLKVHQTTDNSIVEKIIVATNNQNPINPRDLKSNTEEQIKIQKYFHEVFGLFYQRKRNENKDLDGNEIKRKDIVINEKVGQAALALFLDKSNVSLGAKSSIFGVEYDNIYKELSNEKLCFAYFIHKYIESKKKDSNSDNENIKQVEIAMYGTYHLTNIIGKLLLKKYNKDYRKPVPLELVKRIKENEIELGELYVKAINYFEQELGGSTKIFNYLKTKPSNEISNKVFEKIKVDLNL